MSSNRSVAGRFVLRASLIFGLSYLLWLPLQPLYTRLVAALAAPLLRCVEHPPLVTSLHARGDSILFYSFLTSPGEPMASWSGETLGVVVVAPLALVLALPGLRGPDRLVAGAVSAALSTLTAAGVAAVQIRIAAARSCVERWAIVVDEPHTSAMLWRLNGVLHVVGMLAIPSLVFVFGYTYAAWLASRAAPLSARRAGFMVAALGLVGLAAWGGLRVLAPEADAAAAREGWLELLELNPGFAPAHVNVGLALEREGHRDEAVEHYLAAVRADPRLVEGHYNLANARAAQGEDELAIESYRAALELVPDHRAAHRNLALALERLGRPCEALPHLERSVGLAAGPGGAATLEAELERLRAQCL